MGSHSRTPQEIKSGALIGAKVGITLAGVVGVAVLLGAREAPSHGIPAWAMMATYAIGGPLTGAVWGGLHLLGERWVGLVLRCAILAIIGSAIVIATMLHFRGDPVSGKDLILYPVIIGTVAGLIYGTAIWIGGRLAS